MRGARSQYTQPPKASFNGMPSARTSTLLAPLAPTPRTDAPCVVGFAVRLLLRRNNVNPGTWRKASSSVTAALLLSSFDVSTTTFAAVCSRRVGIRSPVTTIVSATGDGWSVITIGDGDPRHSRILEKNPVAETLSFPSSGADEIENAPRLS